MVDKKIKQDNGSKEPIIAPVNVKLKRNAGEVLGFSITGGQDCPHIPGHDGIFVSKVTNGSLASDSLHVGDRILSVNGTDLSNMPHDDAVEIFRAAVGTIFIVIHPNAEQILLSQPSNLMLSQAGSPTYTARNPSRSNSQANSRNGSPTRESTLKSQPADLEAAAEALKKIDQQSSPQVADLPPNDPYSPIGTNVQTPQKNDTDISIEDKTPKKNPLVARHVEEDDGASTISVAPSTRSVVDDVPRTPKKPVSILDPSNPSILTEILFVSIGALAITAACALGYRYVNRR